MADRKETASEAKMRRARANLPGHRTPGYLKPPPKRARSTEASPDRDQMSSLGLTQGEIMDIAASKRGPYRDVLDPIQMKAARRRLRRQREQAKRLREEGMEDSP